MKSQFTRCRALLAFALLALAGTAQAHVGHEGGGSIDIKGNKQLIQNSRPP